MYTQGDLPLEVRGGGATTLIPALLGLGWISPKTVVRKTGQDLSQGLWAGQSRSKEEAGGPKEMWRVEGLRKLFSLAGQLRRTPPNTEGGCSPFLLWHLSSHCLAQVLMPQ